MSFADLADGLTAATLELPAPAAVFLVCGSWAVFFSLQHFFW